MNEYENNWVINYAYRNAYVGDDEQSRIDEEIEVDEAGFFAHFPDAIRDTLRNAIAHEDWETFCEALFPYITNNQLARVDFQAWENALFGEENDE